MSTPNTSQRHIMLDIIKGITIFLVVFGHAIEYGEGFEANESGIRYSNLIYKIIYSIHMPLFMILSGYFFYFTVKKRNFWEIVTSRFTRLIVPIYAWNALMWLIRFILHIRNHQGFDVIDELCNQFEISFFSIWFLWAIFWCSLIVAIIHYFFRDNLYLYILCLIIAFVTPDTYNFHLYKFMYPFFVIAFLFNKYQEKALFLLYKLTFQKALLISAVIYVVLLIFYNNNTYIYTSGYSLLKKDALLQCFIDFHRFFVGFFGCAFILLAMQLLHKKYCFKNADSLLSKLGTNSLGIYIISLYIDVTLLRSPIYTDNIVLLFLESILVLGISYFLTICLKHFKITNTLFLGGR